MKENNDLINIGLVIKTEKNKVQDIADTLTEKEIRIVFLKRSNKKLFIIEEAV